MQINDFKTGVIYHYYTRKCFTVISIGINDAIILSHFDFIISIRCQNNRRHKRAKRKARTEKRNGRPQMLPYAVLWLTADTLMNIQSFNKKPEAIIVPAVRLMPIWIGMFCSRVCDSIEIYPSSSSSRRWMSFSLFYYDDLPFYPIFPIARITVIPINCIILSWILRDILITRN